jgi:hypothetical protein
VKERNGGEEEDVGDVEIWVLSSSSDSTGLNTGEVGLRFEIRSSHMLRCLRMGLQGRGLGVGFGEKRLGRSCAGR